MKKVQKIFSKKIVEREKIFKEKIGEIEKTFKKFFGEIEKKLKEKILRNKLKNFEENFYIQK